MFLGTHHPKIDDKWRMTIPAKFREQLREGLVVTKGPNHSLTVYPRAEFEATAQKVMRASRSDPRMRASLRILAASADEQKLDAQGRIVVSPEHRTWAELDREQGAVVTGSLSEIEIWSQARWSRYEADTAEEFSEAGIDALMDLLP